MNKIKILDQNVSSKIAAGEVVERPVNVVKELVENSIDASATSITIEIKNGGTSQIRVTDNGIGIENEDAIVAFERHSTSKIRDEKDLNHISTLGFRGEALASICAVSQTELITKTKNSITGSMVEINGGQLIKHEEIGCPDGTTIVVNNLFFNTPARLKFLKKDSTEAGLISDLIERLSLTHPEISFKLINNGQTIIHTPGNGDTQSAILSIFGKDFSKAMIPIKFDLEDVKVSGFIGRPEISRSNRNYQCIFINRRFIKNKIISSALEAAYKTLLTVNKYPVCVLYIDLEPSMVDVNVHPAKLEVRFANEETIYNLINEAAANALKNSVLVPQVELKSAHIPEREIDDVNELIDKNKNVFNEKQYIVREKETPYISVASKQPEIKREKESTKTEQVFIPISKSEQSSIEIKKNYNIIGQIFSTYIIIESDEKLLVIDQHAAHERIKYNELVLKYSQDVNLSQSLLSPIVVNLSFSEYKLFLENKELFDSFGYEIDEFGENSILLRSVPQLLGDNLAREFFIETIDMLKNKKIKNAIDLRDEIVFSMACKSAIKANRVLNEIEVKQLVDMVINMESSYTCPHGRPIIISISKYELEKMFKRVM